MRVDDRRDARDWRQSFCGRAKRGDGETDYYYSVSFCLILVGNQLSKWLSRSFGLPGSIDQRLSRASPSRSMRRGSAGASPSLTDRRGSAGASPSLNEEAQRLSRSFALPGITNGHLCGSAARNICHIKQNARKPTGHDRRGSEYRKLHRHVQIRTQASCCDGSPGSGYFIDTPKSLARKAVTL